jgi:hypothetical protein
VVTIPLNLRWVGIGNEKQVGKERQTPVGMGMDGNRFFSGDGMMGIQNSHSFSVVRKSIPPIHLFLAVGGLLPIPFTG